MITKVVSGGQTGADRAGLIAAKKAGIPTGGWIPKGALTEEGSKPELLTEYGLQETLSKEYAFRTELNVKMADATLRFAANWSSPGEKCTLKAIKKHKKLHYDVDIRETNICEEEMDALVDWLFINNIKILNVAGNKETTAPGIGLWVEKFLDELFDHIRT